MGVYSGHRRHSNMKLVAYGGLIWSSCAFASSRSGDFIQPDEAKQVINSRVRRGWSELSECFGQGNFCDEYEEFAEAAENEWGKPLIRENRKSQVAFENFYTECHSDDYSCRDKGSSCKCNVQLKNWLDNPSSEPDTTTTTTTTTTTATEDSTATTENTEQTATTAFGEGTTQQPALAPGLDELGAWQPPQSKNGPNKNCICKCAKSRGKKTGKVERSGRKSDKPWCVRKCRRKQINNCRKLQNKRPRPGSKGLPTSNKGKCYKSDKTLPTDAEGHPLEIKCGLKGAYKSTKLKNGEFGLFDPDNHNRFTDGNIVFGNKTKEGEIPWQVSFRAKKNSGGTFKDENF